MSSARAVKKIVSAARAQRERNRTKAEGLLRKIERLRVRMSRDFYELGRALAALSAPALYEALGYDSFAELLVGRSVMSRTQAGRLIDVVNAYPREQALELGPEKAYALLRYAAATPADDVATALAASNARIGRKSVRTLTVRELTGLTRRLTARRSTVDPELRSARRQATEAQRKIRAQGARGVVMSARRAAGQTWIRIDVPVDELETLMAGLERGARRS